MAEKLAANSILKFTPLVNADGVLHWDLPNIPVIEPQNDDLRHEVKQEQAGRIDLIAHDYYGDSNLWWVIMVANNKMDVTDLAVGEQLVIPSPRYVKSTVLAFGVS